jgi:hypothetical protein
VLLAFGTDFAHVAEGDQVEWLIVIGPAVDNRVGVQFAEDQVVVRAVLAPA